MDSSSRPAAGPPLVPSTPAQELFVAACAGGVVHDKASFAALLGVDAGNIYNYLADAGRPNWIPAKTDTLRRWGRSIAQGSGGRLTVRVTEDPDGVIEVVVEGRDAGGRVVDRTSRRSPSELSGHVLGSEAARRCCDGLLEALKAFGGRAERRIREKQCEFVVGKMVLGVEHGADTHLHAFPVHQRGDPQALCAALDRHGLAWEAQTGRGGAARSVTRRVVLRVGDAHVFPEQLARALASFNGWEVAEVGTGASDGEGETFTEGHRVLLELSRYERDPKARAACLARLGVRCAACDVSFGERYGALGEGFIHVHHVMPLGERGEEHEVDPVRDLVPVCPNCHAMIHRGRGPARSIREVRAMLARAARPRESARRELAGDP